MMDYKRAFLAASAAPMVIAMIASFLARPFYPRLAPAIWFIVLAVLTLLLQSYILLRANREAEEAAASAEEDQVRWRRRAEENLARAVAAEAKVAKLSGLVRLSVGDAQRIYSTQLKTLKIKVAELQRRNAFLIGARLADQTAYYVELEKSQRLIDDLGPVLASKLNQPDSDEFDHPNVINHPRSLRRIGGLRR